jgi:hypothetical protein
MDIINDIQKAAFISEGGIVVHRIGYNAKQHLVAEDESAVASLVAGKGSHIFGLTYGKKSHLFLHDSWSIDNFVLLVKPVADNTTGGELFCTGTGIIYGIAKAYTEDGVKNTMFRYDVTDYHLTFEMVLREGAYEEIECPFADRRVAGLTIDSACDIAYGIFTDDKVLFSYEVESGEVTELGKIGESLISNVLAIDDGGSVYCVGDWGRLLCYNPAYGFIEDTGVLIPSGRGKEYVSQASALTFDSRSNVLYGGTLVDGYFFKFDVCEQTMICLGKPIDQRHIRALAVIPDGRVYGIAGEPKTGMCHMFKYDPVSGDLRDLGLVTAALSETWIAHEIDAMAVNSNGHIVMAENDRMSHVFVYFPPIEAR